MLGFTVSDINVKRKTFSRSLSVCSTKILVFLLTDGIMTSAFFILIQTRQVTTVNILGDLKGYVLLGGGTSGRQESSTHVQIHLIDTATTTVRKEYRNSCSVSCSTYSTSKHFNCNWAISTVHYSQSIVLPNILGGENIWRFFWLTSRPNVPNLSAETGLSTENLYINLFSLYIRNCNSIEQASEIKPINKRKGRRYHLATRHCHEQSTSYLQSLHIQHAYVHHVSINYGNDCRPLSPVQTVQTYIAPVNTYTVE